MSYQSYVQTFYIDHSLVCIVINHERTTEEENVLRLSRHVNFDRLFELGLMKF
jgi:hypothetical protein